MSEEKNTIDALVGAVENYLEARQTFFDLDPGNPDCGPEVARYSIAKTKLNAALALAKKKA